MVQLVFTATGNVPKLADTINGVTSYGLHDSFRIATEISRGIERKFPISSIEKTTDIINKTMPAGTLAWHFLNDTTGEIFGGSSGKKSKGNKKESKINSEYIQELKNTSINAVQSIVSYCEKLEVELAKVYNQRDTLLKERAELIAKLDTLSDKFIKLKSIIE